MMIYPLPTFLFSIPKKVTIALIVIILVVIAIIVVSVVISLPPRRQGRSRVDSNTALPPTVMSSPVDPPPTVGNSTMPAPTQAPLTPLPTAASPLSSPSTQVPTISHPPIHLSNRDTDGGTHIYIARFGRLTLFSVI
jgi:hypothetical protein